MIFETNAFRGREKRKEKSEEKMEERILREELKLKMLFPNLLSTGKT